MREKIFLLIFFFVFFSSAGFVNAESDFKSFIKTSYLIKDDYSAVVSQEISLINLRADLYVAEYTLTVNSKNIDRAQGWDRLGALPITVVSEKDLSRIAIKFNEKIVGKDQSQSFIVKYELPDFVKQEGLIKRVVLPGLATESLPESYSLEVKIPKSFGPLALSFPNPEKLTQSSDFQTFSFNKKNLINSGVILEFGDYQLFDFKLNFSLTNESQTRVKKVISLPPDTNYQKVFYSSIEPLPENITVDQDGNWLAEFYLEANESKTILATGKVKLYSFPNNKIENYYLDYKIHTQEDNYWEKNDLLIQKAVQNLSSPKEIYDFVIKTLTYDLERISSRSSRLGAVEALKNPRNALCTEFTDLFIALSRAIGIPSREIEGFAFSNNSKLKPLNFNRDILHSWPEYYSESANRWIMVDPSWGETTGGFDYFNGFDMAHFAFVIHGNDSRYPFPAGSYNPLDLERKNVFVDLTNEGFPDVLPNLKTEVNFDKISLFNKTLEGSILISNQGKEAFYDLTIKPANNENGFTASNEKVRIIPPFGKTSVAFNLLNPRYLRPSKEVESLSVYIGDSLISSQIPSINLELYLFIGAAVIFTFLLVLALAIYFLRRVIKLPEKNENRL